MSDIIFCKFFDAGEKGCDIFIQFEKEGKFGAFSHNVRYLNHQNAGRWYISFKGIYYWLQQ